MKKMFKARGNWRDVRHLQFMERVDKKTGFIYFLVRRRVIRLGYSHQIVYVGQTINIAARVTYYDHQRKEWHVVHYLEVPRRLLYVLEGAFIKFFQPEYNSENLLNTEINQYEENLVREYLCGNLLEPDETKMHLDKSGINKRRHREYVAQSSTVST